MEPWLHTLIATGLLAIAFYLGRFVENRDLIQELGSLHAEHITRFLIYIEATSIDIDIDEDTMIITFEDGSQDSI